MLEKATIARPYAEAAFSQAVEEGKLADWSAMLAFLRLIVTDDNMLGVLNNPKLDNQQLAQFIIDIGSDTLSKTGKNFIHILVNAGRIGLIAEIADIFEQQKAFAEGISAVDVISAYPLNDAQVNELSESISKQLGKKVSINPQADKELIGGVIIRAGDTVIDASLRGRLKKLNNIFAQ